MKNVKILMIDKNVINLGSNPTMFGPGCLI